jgi:flagellin
MTISIPGANAALAALDSLTNQQGASSDVAGLLADPTQNDGAHTSSPDSNAAVIDLTGGRAASLLNGLAGRLLTSASAADAAVSAGSTIQALLAQMRQAADTATNPSLSSAQRQSLDSGFQANLANIQSAVAGASVDGVNLIDGSAPSGAAATFAGVNLSLGGPLIGLGPGANLLDPLAAATIAGQLGTALGNVGQAINQLSSQGQAVQAHLVVVAQAGSALSPGLSNDLSADGARLAALQVRQQLTSGAGAIANQTPQAILSLFR